jgi:hypothetical protein
MYRSMDPAHCLPPKDICNLDLTAVWSEREVVGITDLVISSVGDDKIL